MNLSISQGSTKISNRTLYILFFIVTVIYIATLKLRPYPLSYIVKIIPIIILMVTVYFNLYDKKRNKILAALFFSAIGDVILALNGKTLFIYGLICFAVAHIFYIWTFIQSPSINKLRLFYACLFILYGIIITIILAPRIGGMLLPVLAYQFIIISMGISASVGGDNHYIVIIGAILFVISDSVIAFNMFYAKISFSSFWIMITYFPAQFLIMFGTIKRT